MPSVRTPRVLLRGFVPSDYEPMLAMLGDREVLLYLPRTEPWPEEIVRKWMAHQKDHWERHGYGWFAAEHRETGSLMGWCGLNRLEETGEVEVLYLLDKPFWGQGLATEAARPCIRTGFAEHGLESIIGLTHPDNIGSQRVLEKIGLSYRDQVHYWGMDLRRYRVDREDVSAQPDCPVG